MRSLPHAAARVRTDGTLIRVVDNPMGRATKTDDRLKKGYAGSS